LVVGYLMFVIVLPLYFLIITPYARLERSIRVRRKLKPRIVWGPIPVINIHYGSLADRLYGYKSKTIVHTTYPINEPGDYDYVIDKYFKTESGLLSALCRLVAPYFIFLWASLRYDIFQFYFHGGFLGYSSVGARLEFPLLHLAGKKIIVTPYGSDARLESKTRKYEYNFCMDCTLDTKTCDEKKILRKLEYFAKHSDLVLGCADLVDTLPRWDGIWQFPINLSEWPPAPPSPDSKIVKVVHATNHRMYKGTHFLISAIDELKSEGYPVELILVERMSNKEAKRIYQEADIIADQFIGGAYALFAIEGMALGKPVMCYLREGLYQYHPEWAECPIVNTNPGNIKQQLIKLITDKQLRRELGRRSPEYVKKYHSLESVGSQLDNLYRFLWDK
jgi:hypothetical protein